MGTPRTWPCVDVAVSKGHPPGHVSTAAGDSDRRAVDAHGDPAAPGLPRGLGDRYAD